MLDQLTVFVNGQYIVILLDAELFGKTAKISRFDVATILRTKQPNPGREGIKLGPPRQKAQGDVGGK